MNKKFEYAIIPFCFKDYSQLVDALNEDLTDGWEVVTLIRTYKDSPEKGVTSHDFLCKREITD